MSSSALTPQPFVVTPSQVWDGIVGSWSSFIICVGTLPQCFRVLPATTTGEIWIPVPLGCTSRDPSTCASSRGVLPFEGKPSNGFQTNQSSTWVSNGLYGLDIETHVNLTGNGQYGFDRVSLGVQNTDSPTLLHQVVAGIATKDFYLGVFGLGPKPSNFSSSQDPQPTFLSNLASRGLIPSLSFGYTAGAKYSHNGVFGSLILGGYDLNRLETNNSMIFTFDEDDSRSLTVAIQLITVTNTLKGVLEPLATGILSLIDSSVPDIWLPVEVCHVFEQAFGLIYDSTTDLYLVNDTIRGQLQNLNPSITLRLSNATFGGPFTNIVLPYEAFDLQVTSSEYADQKNYFPLRRAMNESQYTLGRTFLQEAYIIVDYERSNFTVAPAVASDSNPQRIVAIDSTKSRQPSRNSPSLSQGVIAGIVVGAAILGLIGIAAAFVLTRRWRRRPHLGSMAPQNSLNVPLEGSQSVVEQWEPQELSCTKVHSATTQEIDSRPLYEIVGSPTETQLDVIARV